MVLVLLLVGFDYGDDCVFVSGFPGWLWGVSGIAVLLLGFPGFEVGYVRRFAVGL